MTNTVYTIGQMRLAIAGVYNTTSWKRKVREMPDYQVYAIYYKFLRDGKFDEDYKERKRKKEARYQQLTIWDFL